MFGINGKSKLKTELAGAAVVLEKYARLQSAIKTEVSASLATAIEQHEAARKDLETAEAEAALGAEGQRDAVKPKKKLSEIREKIDAISAKIRGLRTAFAGLSNELAARYETLSMELPEHHAEVRQAFSSEWAEGVARFSALLGKRQQLEQLTGEKLTLSEPQAVTGDLGPAGEPRGRLRALKSALAVIAGTYGDTGERDLQGRVFPALETYRVYRLRRAAGDLPPGALALEGSLPPGLLRRLAEFGDVVPADYEDLAQAALSAQGKVHDIESGQAEREAEARHVREQKRKKTLTLEEAGYLYPGLTDEERYLRVKGTPEAHMQPEDIERERQRRERERVHSAAEQREREKALAWPGGLAKEEPQQAPAAQETNQ